MTDTGDVIPAVWIIVWPCHVPTPLVDPPWLAGHCGVAKVVLKDELPVPQEDDA
jgi:hypothetical protein